MPHFCTVTHPWWPKRDTRFIIEFHEWLSSIPTWSVHASTIVLIFQGALFTPMNSMYTFSQIVTSFSSNVGKICLLWWIFMILFCENYRVLLNRPHKDVLCGHMTFQDLDDFGCKLKCKERGSKTNTLLLFMCATNYQVLRGHVDVILWWALATSLF